MPAKACAGIGSNVQLVAVPSHTLDCVLLMDRLFLMDRLLLKQDYHHCPSGHPSALQQQQQRQQNFASSRNWQGFPELLRLGDTLRGLG